MNSNEALALACIKYWCRVVLHKNGSCGEIDADGRPWSRITPDECAEWIAKFFLVELTPRQCANALRSLERTGMVVREQRALHKWVRTFSYSPTDWRGESLDVPLPVQSTPPNPAPSREPVPVPLTNSSPPSSTNNSAVQSEVGIGRSDGSAPPAPSAVATNYRSTGLQSSVPQGSKSLAEIAALCAEKGGLPALPLKRCKDGFLINPNQ